MTFRRNLVTILFLFSLSFLSAVAGVISGKIETCAECSLARLPHLKAFIVGLGAEMYQNVEIEFIYGTAAVLTVFDDGVEVETIMLADYETRAELDALFKEKGFKLKTASEISEISNRKAEEEHQKILQQMRERREKANKSDEL
eukprot:CAMPEP_0194371858 /NCGR_PEP_ID=MMETSP0174-20130528/20227_1 /TAXON_ID=216777 /ORGANISM="Proboscia alata, Strain PI-D3" /LENGTH=143 /DNA_ID=CAMNT_0039150097 /DNA_START=40 /DNA_END=471 /DNA_ORIENTATION=+